MNWKDRFERLAVLIMSAALFSCSGDPAPTSPKTDPAGRALTPAAPAEEEVFGDVWDSGVPVSTFKYRVMLEVHPSDDTYFQRGNRSFSTVQPVDPAKRAQLGLVPFRGRSVTTAVLGLNPFKGDIAEVIIYTTSLSDADMEATEEYLRDKYGLPGP